MGEPLPILFVSCFCKGVQRPEPADRPSNCNKLQPSSGKKKHHQFGAICGNDGSFTNKADLSATDGINSEHKKEQRQSSKDVRLARRRGHPTSRRRVRNCAGPHGQGESAPCHQPTPTERVRTTHQANTTPLGDMTSPTSPKRCYRRRTAPRPSSRSE